MNNIKMALASLWANKMRALLTMLGIIIGIGAVIAIMTLSNSLTGSLSDSMSGLGANNITVSLTEKTQEDDSGGVEVHLFRPSQPTASDLLTQAMIDEYCTTFSEKIRGIELTESVGSGTLTLNNTDYTVTLTGTNLEYASAADLNVYSGRYLNETDEEKSRGVCVISQALAETLYGSAAEGVGEQLTVEVSGTPLKLYVVGLYEDTDSETGEDYTTTEMYLPMSTAKRYSGGDAGYQSLTVVVNNTADTTDFVTVTESFFASFYTRNADYTVEASNMQSLTDTITSMLDTVSLALSAIAAISLLVGGIGVMNIMLVSITERTREIGTRKALGAPRSAIRLQFITESVIICLIGGALGILLGTLLGSAASNWMGYSGRADVTAIAYAVVFSTAIGVFFGYYPANKAAKMDPIDALRYE